LPFTVVKGAKALHRPRIRLVHELAREPTLAVLAEVAVLKQERHLERRSLGELEGSLPVVADDPQARESRVHGEPGYAHDVIVVPEQRRSLAHLVVTDRVLTGREDVLRPAVIGRRRQSAVQVHDREPRERGGIRIASAAAETGNALHRDAVGAGLGRRDRDRDGQHPVELVDPLDPDPMAALGLDRRAGDAALVAPDPRLRQVAVKPMTAGAHVNLQPPPVLARQHAARQRQRIDERRERRSQSRRGSHSP
jgi:hypothetical protein